MPFTVKYTEDPVGVIATFSGVVTADEIISHLNQIHECKNCVYRLGDMRATTKVDISIKDLHKIAILECSIPEDYKLEKLALVDDKSIHNWIVDTYFTFVERWIGKRHEYETRRFENIDEACHWLGISHMDECLATKNSA